MATEERIDALIGALSGAAVEFIVIGGVAVGWHGYVRATKDIDVVPDPDPDNLRRLATTLVEIGATVQGADDFDPAELPDPTDPEVLALGGNWVLQTDLGRLDLMQVQGDMVLWPKLHDRAVAGRFDNLPMRVCSYEDLIELKRDAGRPQDLVDIEQLRLAQSEG